LNNLQTPPELTPEVLASHPSSEALPPVYPPQNFLQRPGQQNQNLYGNQELSSLPVQGQVTLPQHSQHGENVDDTQEEPHGYVTKHGSQRPDGKRLKGQPSSGLPQLPLIENVGDEEEEVRICNEIPVYFAFFPTRDLSCSIDRFQLVYFCNSVRITIVVG